MKKLLFIYLIALCPIIKAQYTLTSSIKPAVGDIQSSMSIDTTGLVFGTSGTNQIWNFPWVNAQTSSVYSSTFMPLSSTSYSTCFSNATIVKYDGTTYGFYNTATTIDYLGSVSGTSCNVLQNSNSFVTFPFSYGSNYSDTYVDNFNGLNTSGTVTTSGDATGTLNIPNFSFNNVLRVKVVTHIVFSGSLSGTIDQVTYDYFSSNSKFYLLSLSSQTSVISGTTISKFGSVNASFSTGIKENLNPVSFSIYPNPSSLGEIYLLFQNNLNEKTDIFFVNSIGQTIKTVSLKEINYQNPVVSISTVDMSPGIYFMKVKTDKGESIKKIILQ